MSLDRFRNSRGRGKEHDGAEEEEEEPLSEDLKLQNQVHYSSYTVSIDFASLKFFLFCGNAHAQQITFF
jgi:hypothetical protein